MRRQLLKKIDANKTRRVRRLFASNLMSDVIGTHNLDAAFFHVFNSRKKDGPNSDIWDLSANWVNIRAQIQKDLLSNTYQLTPLLVVRSRTQGYLSRWSSLDAVILRALSQVLSVELNPILSSDCYHVKGRGGLHGAVKNVRLYQQKNSIDLSLNLMSPVFMTAWTMASLWRICVLSSKTKESYQSFISI